MSIEDSQQQFEDLIRSNSNYSWWVKLLNSQMLRGIAGMVAQAFRRNEFSNARALQETRLSTALNRSSILAKAEDYGYIPRKVLPAEGDLSVTNKTGELVYVPAFTEFISDTGLIYSVIDGFELIAGETKTVRLKQVKRRLIASAITETKKYTELLLSKDLTSKVADLKVLVETENTAAQYWTRTYQFRNTNSTSKAYTEIYKATDQMGVRFSNGQNGRLIEAGSTVTLEVLESNGDTELLAGVQLELLDSKSALKSRIQAVTATAITGGAPQESIEEVRKGVLYAISYDNQIVWGDDYQTYIRNNVAGLNRVAVWGEAEQEIELGVRDIENLNAIFVSAYSPLFSQSEVETRILAAFANADLLNRRIKYMPVNLSPYTLELTGRVSKARSTTETVELVREQLRLRYGLSAEGFVEDGVYRDPSEVKKKDLWKFVDSLGVFLDFEIEVTGLDGARLLADYRYLDSDASTFTITN